MSLSLFENYLTHVMFHVIWRGLLNIPQSINPQLLLHSCDYHIIHLKDIHVVKHFKNLLYLTKIHTTIPLIHLLATIESNPQTMR